MEPFVGSEGPHGPSPHPMLNASSVSEQLGDVVKKGWGAWARPSSRPLLCGESGGGSWGEALGTPGQAS